MVVFCGYTVGVKNSIFIAKIIKKTPKIRFKRVTGSLCDSLAPNGAVK